MKEDFGIAYGKVDITPNWKTELVGFDRESNMSKGVLDRLYAQVLLLKNIDKINALITIDSLGFTVELTNKLRKLIAIELNTKIESIMICFSHTHSAPNPAIDLKYYDFVCKNIMECIVETNKNYKICKVGWGESKCEIGINRRGESYNLDNSLGILKISSIDTKFNLVILRVVAHANVLSADNYLISSDYFGETRELINEKLGCEVMILQGASGNIRPKYQQSNAVDLEINYYEEIHKNYTKKEKEKFFRESINSLERMAETILESLNNVYNDIDLKDIDRIMILSENKEFCADVPTVEKSEKIGEEACEFANINPNEWMEEVKRLNKNKVLTQKSNIEMQYFIINNGGFCGLANEIMCELDLEFRNKLNKVNYYLNGYTNGTSSYLPNEIEYEKGGYEVLWSNLVYFKYHGRVMPLNKDSAEKIIDLVIDKLKVF